MIRRTLAATIVAASAVAAIAAAAGPSGGQENSGVPAAARNYWAFKLPVQAPLPEASGRFQNPIDRFLEETRRTKGLQAAPRAARAVLVRRAYLDLIGLPPTYAELMAFVEDPLPTRQAFAKVVDRLLASPHYGERWGRFWLDTARYADTIGGSRWPGFMGGPRFDR